MMKQVKRYALVLASLCIYVISLPLAFAKSATHGERYAFNPGDSVESGESTAANAVSRRSVYDSLHLDLKGLNRQAFEYAVAGFLQLKERGLLENDSVITIADFSQPSNRKRLYVVDVKNFRVLFHTLVAHGKNTGHVMATTFSNQMSSYMSSPGFYITSDTYMGGNGYSLRLLGLERGINDRALERTIVMHGANYVSHYRARSGFVGRSWGCPAVPMEEAKPIINTIRNGSMLFIYTPDKSYVTRSELI